MSDNDYRWYNDVSKQFLKRDYLLPGQTLDERVRSIAQHAERLSGREGFAEKIVNAVQKGWWSFSTPVWTNYGQRRGLPISCFGTHISDSIASLAQAFAEITMMSKYGGGTSAYFGSFRPQGSEIKDNGKAGGPNYFLPLFEQLVKTITQGSTRNANMAVYLDVEHPDIARFLEIQDDTHPIQSLHYGVSIGDEWLESMRAGDPDKRAIQASILTSRNNKGEPYIFFRDNVRRNTVDVYRDKGMEIRHSNLCSEIALPTNDEESFVCCLSSLNLIHWDEWRDTDTIADMVLFLDTVITDFIERARSVPFMERAVRFAERHRALGMGVLGYHSMLQSKMIPFESMEAKLLNATIFKQIKQQSWEASRKLAQEFGEPEILKGYGRRNTTLTAIAPTVSSSSILGQASRAIEPYLDNYHIVDTAKLKYTFRNEYLPAILEKYKNNTDGVWDSILDNRGSVQHLKFLSDHEKAVFKTFPEINPMEVITQAAQRQPFLDQTQSLNLFIHPSMEPKDKMAIILEAWQKGVSTIYYQHNVNAAQEFSRELNCKSCSA
jgi:ribonucleoside-diphosphate reductase alpha chain